MNRRERLMATLQGKPVDRPAVSFYEINGLDENPNDHDPFNIYTHPSWQPVIQLACQETDRMVRREVPLRPSIPDELAERTRITTTIAPNGHKYTHTSIRTDSRILTSTTIIDPDINTTWTVEHLLKDIADLEAYITLPRPPIIGELDCSGVLEAEAALGDTGIVLIDIADPLCHAAESFDMQSYLPIAFQEPRHFKALLEWHAESILPLTEMIARALPGRLWRIVGPEMASAPYLPPRLFRDYATHYDRQMVESIQRWGGYARIHSHGRLRAILDDIHSTGCAGTDPIEPPPQGDVELIEVRERYGKDWVLFGNLEASDLETLSTPQFEEKIKRALAEGTAGTGRGFVLMPSACPYGRELPSLAMKNYEKMVEAVQSFG